jgi:hypothetical protein
MDAYDVDGRIEYLALVFSTNSILGLYAAGPGTHFSLGGFSLMYTRSNLSLETPKEKDWTMREEGIEYFWGLGATDLLTMCANRLPYPMLAARFDFEVGIT